MNITQEKVNNLNSVLKIKLGPADYQQKVDSQLKEIQRKASMPGFRPGKVPVGLVKKMYGKSVLADEINKLLNHSVNEYINTNKIEIIGQPIPVSSENDSIDWDNLKDVEFSYELGHAPEFSINIDNEPFEYKMIKVDDTMVDKEIEEMQRRYGKVSNPEKAEAEDIVFGEFAELDQEENVLSDGIKKSSSVAINTIKNADLAKRFEGLKKEDTIILDPHDITGNLADLGAMLGITKPQAESLSSKFRFTINNISRVELAELNQEFYHKIYGDSVNSIEEFRAKIKSELNSMFNAESDKFFMSDVIKGLVKKYDLQLPEEFLKRWLLLTNDKKQNTEQIEKEFPIFAERLKTQLVINKVLKQNNIVVAEDEIRNYVKDLIKKQYAMYNGGIEMEEEDLSSTTNRILSDEKEYNRIVEKLYDNRLLEFFKSKLKLNFTEVPFEEFYHRH